MISVVVPIYNVDKFLEQCIESIINQTYKDIEIILVDDGSTDDSGKICDSYRAIDNRIIVIHKKNEGLSSARNAGLEVAHGEYICFIDSDDYIHIRMFEIMESYIRSADIVICGKRDIWGTGSNNIISESLNVDYQIDTMSGERAFEHFLLEDNEGYVVAWNKLYRTRTFLLNGIRYPEGKIHEDCFTTYRLFIQSDRVVYIDIPLYNYRHRDGSIMCNHDMLKDMFIMEAYSEVLNVVNSKYPNYVQAAQYRYILACLFCADRTTYRKNRKYLLKLRKNIKSVNWKNNCYLKGQRRFRTAILYYLPHLYPYIRICIDTVRRK